MINPNSATIKADVGAILAAAQVLSDSCATNAAALAAMDAPESADAVNQLKNDMAAAIARLIEVFRSISDIES